MDHGHEMTFPEMMAPVPEKPGPEPYTIEQITERAEQLATDLKTMTLNGWFGSAHSTAQKLNGLLLALHLDLLERGISS